MLLVMVVLQNRELRSLRLLHGMYGGDLEILCELFYEVTHCRTKRAKGSSIGEHFHSSSIHYVPGQSHIRMQIYAHTCIYIHIYAQTHMCTHIHIHPGILERVAFPSSREPSQPRGRTQVSHIAGGFYSLIHLGSPMCKHSHVYIHT